jgi:hypothetical protein
VFALGAVAAVTAVSLALWSPWSGGRDYGFLTPRQAQTLTAAAKAVARQPPGSRVEGARVYRTTWERFSRLTGDHMCCHPTSVLILVLRGDLTDCHSTPGPGVNPCTTTGEFFSVYRPRPLAGLMGGLGHYPWATLGPSVELDVS